MERQLQKYFILSILFIHVDKYLNMDVGTLQRLNLLRSQYFQGSLNSPT